MDSLLSWRPAELPTSWAPSHGWSLAWILDLLAVAIILAFAWLASRYGRRLSARAGDVARRWLLGLLLVSAGLAVATYVDFGVFRYGSYINEWDFYHYYMGTKYAPELGYTKLYGATLIADVEGGLRYHHPHGQLRDLDSAQLRSVLTVAAEAQRFRGGFSAARWREFVDDVSWFKRQLPENRWSIILADHGYNGTPAWSFVVGGLVTRHLSVRHPISRWLMLFLDPALLAGVILAVAWAFGMRAALLTVVFIGTHYLFSWGHLKGALLRTDFAVGALLAVCLVKKGRYKLAGVALGWATLSRIFPAFLLIGPSVLLALGVIRSRQIDRRLAGLLLTTAATIAIVGLGSCLYFGGTGIWSEWARKISLHYVEGSDWDLGFRTIAESSFVGGVPMRDASIALVAGEAVSTAVQPVTLVVMLLLALPALTFLRELEHHEAVAYGFVFIFLFSLASYYYYLILCVPLLFFLSDLERPQNALGAAGMFLAGAFGYALFSGWAPLRGWTLVRSWHQTFPTYYYMSWLVGLTVVQMIALAAWRARRREQHALSPVAGRALTAPPDHRRDLGAGE